MLEIASPGDESYKKLDFYAARGVDEVVIVDREKHKVQWLRLAGEQYAPADHSGLIELGAADLERQISWP